MSVNSHFKSSVRSAQGLLQNLGLAVLFLLIGSGNAWGEYSTAPAGTYNLVTDASTLTAGDIIIIAGTNNGTTKAISTTQNTNNRASVEVTLSSNSITLAADNTVQGITLEAGTKSETFSFNTGDGYLYAASSKNNYLKTENEKSNNSSWTISISNGDATIIAQGTNTRSLMRYNHSNNPPIFSCYANNSTTGVLVNIYKKAASGYTVTIAKNNDSYGTVTQSSVTGVTSGTSISASGNVLSVGATNVTATPNSGYKFTGWIGIPGGGTVTDNVTVTANFAAVSYSNYRTLCTTTNPTVTVSLASLTGLDYIVGNGPSTAKSFSMSGSNLENSTLTITAPTNFEVSLDNSSWGSSKTKPANGTLAATTVYVRLAVGKNAGEYSGNVSISGCGLASAVNVAVSGTVYKPTIVVDPASVSWSTAVSVAPTTQNVTVTGTHLKGAISAALNGTDAGSFSISTSSIDKATAEGAGGTITITYTGSYAATTTKTANIALTASDATTVNVPITFNVITDPNLYFLTNLEDIGPKDKVIIVSYKDAGGLAEEDRALPSYPTYTKDPSSVDVKDLISANRQTLSYSETALQWNIVYNSTTGQFTANQYGEDDVKLACKDDNAGVQLGTNYTNTTFTLETVKISGTDYLYIKNIETGRYLGVYNSNSWKCYNPLNSNIYNQDVAFYVQKSTDPYVLLSSSFSEFTYEYTHGPSVAQSFTVSGANLNTNLVVSAPTNYEVCKTEGGTYTSSVEFTPSTGTVSEQTVYIRLAAGKAVGEYNYAKADGLAVTSTGADDVKAALTGSVTPQSFTVTATSSDVNHGTVSPASQNTTTNMTITASPVAGYRVISGAGGYTVTAGTASVTNNGDNTFTVTPSTDCTVQINFEAIPTHKVRYWASGTIVQESDVCEGAAIPDQTAETAGEIEAYCNNREHFVGWTTNSAYSHATDAPDGMITTMSPGGTMSTSDVNYYAVFANTGGVGSTFFSRVTSLSQLADGDVIAIVAEQSGGQIFSTSADHKGGSAPTETDGKITVSASSNQWTLKASDTSWKLHKGDNNADILCADLTYSASGNAMSIVDAKTSNYFFIKSSSKALEYYNSKWQFFSISNPVTDTQNGNVRLKIYKQDAGYVDYTTQCCALKPVTGVEVSGKTGNTVTLRWSLPSPTTGIDKFQIIDVDNANNVVVDNILNSATSATVSGLAECNTYHYKVVSYSAECTVSSATVEAQPFGGAKTVTFNYNGGTGTPDSFTTSCGNLSTTLPAATQDGYTFLGWWTAADGGSKVGDAEAEYPVSTTTTIHAHWAQNFTITYDRVGGTDVCANETCGAGMTYTVCGTEPTKSGYIFAGWKDASTSVVYNAGDNFTMPAADVTLTAQWTANWRNLTFNVPAGGGSITGGPSGNHVLDNRTFTFPNITGKSDAKWCWTFLGWTETAPNGSGTWATTPSYIAGGATSGAITSDKTYYAVYSKTGAGASGDVECDAEAIKAIGTGGGHVYADEEWTIAAADQSSWKARAYVANKGTYLQIKEDAAIYIKLPTVGGNYSSITLNHNSNSSSRTIVYRTDKNGDIVASHTTGASETSSTIDISGGSTTGYIMMTGSYTYQITSITAHFGPPAVYGHTLDDCGCQVTQFNLTYNANSTTFPGSTISCNNEVDYVFASHGDEYTFCSAPTPPTGYRFLYWAENANGTGNHWEAGETVSCLPSADLTVYAFYERVYTVTFNNQGVSTPITQASAGASVAVPDATTPCNGEWAFVGWSETAIAPMSFLPTLEIAAGEGTYTPTADKTLYAIYRKTSESSPFVAGMSGAYKISNGSTVYAGAASTKLAETDAAGAVTYYITYTAADGGKYTIQRNDGKYIAYSGSSTELAVSDAAYYWTMTKNGDLWHVLGVGSGRYLQYSSGTGFKAYNTNGPTDIAFVAAEGEYYYRTMSCADEFDITFHNNGTTINWAGGYPEAAYKGLADATVISTFPTATFDGWTFIGWRQADYKESTDAPASSSVFGGSNGTSGNKLTIASANVDLYPVFTRFEDNEPFDQINGGDYYIYFLESGSDDGYGAEKRVYAATYDGDKRYSSTAVCDNATTFTFTKLDNGNWTIYDKTTKKYLYGVANDALKQQASATGAEWTLTLNGNQFDAFHVGTTYGQITASGNGTSATFMNYSRDNLKSNPGLYHRVYLGSCTNRTFTTNPSTTPNIEIHGQVKVTSTAGKSIKSTSVLTVSASNIATANLTVTSNNGAFKFSLTSNGTYTESVNISVVSNKVGVTPIYVEYTPSATEDGIEEATITVSDGASPTPTTATTESGDVQGRHVPANFVIAAKWGNKWYALPANCTESTSSTTGVLIEVDNASDPTTATYAPSYTKWGLQTVRPSRKGEYGTRLVFTEQVTTATAEDQKTLYNGSTTNIQANAMYQNYMGDATDKYEWIPTTTDLKDYILTSATTLGGDASARTVSLSNKGVFGTLLTNKAYDGKVRLLPATFVEPAEIQVVEWKASSVVVMYTGSGTKATTQLGDDTPISAQSLTAAKKDHGVFELTTGTLTSAKNEPLNITIQNGSDAIVGRKSFVVPAIVSGSQDAPLGLTSDEATLTDVVVLDGATLSAAATKYTFKNITVYPGGKLVIGSGKQLGMASLTLRGGSAWGAATYEHKYPQFVVNNATDGAYSNTSGVINYDYVTTKDQYYSFVLPYNGSTSAIKYPLDIYGSAVSASNTGSFEFQYYDGAARAAGGTGWKVLAEPATLVAGTGYTFLGMPKKVDAYDGTDDSHANSRQRYGIHRIPMNVAAAAVQAGETNSDPGKATPISVTLVSKNNDSGWNLVGNPYLSNVSGLSNQDIQVGKLVHTSTVPWDGKWQWDDTNPATGVRYIVTTDDGQNFESQQASTATLKAFKNFFVQIQNGGATSLVIPANTRTDKDLAPARYMADVEQDIQLAVDLVSETRSDKVDLLINDIYTAEFDQDGDFTKMMNTTKFNLYGVYPDDYLSFIAVDKTTAAGSIAVGYQVPAGGDYTLQLSDREYVMTDAIEALYVTDHEVSPEVTTDLLDGPYNFHVNNAETNNTRFTLSIRLAPETPTDIEIVPGEGLNTDNAKPMKFIWQDKMYILRNGVIYDATGKKVK